MKSLPSAAPDAVVEEDQHVVLPRLDDHRPPPRRKRRNLRHGRHGWRGRCHPIELADGQLLFARTTL
jgi:hypothetical protein